MTHDVGKTAADGPDGTPVQGRPAEDGAAREGVAPEGARGGGAWALARELGVVLVVALVLSILIKTLLVQAFYIPSESMEDTLVKDDKVVVSKLTPGPFDLKRGDVVVFKQPGWLTQDPKPERGGLHKAAVSALTFVGILPSDSGEHLIKRVIGLPGDKVVCCDDRGLVSVNGAPIDETSYLKPGASASGTPFSITVPEGRLWVMGDNRNRSADSRFHRENGFDGTVPMDSVVGRAFVLVWPADRFRWLSNPGDVFADVPAPR